MVQRSRSTHRPTWLTLCICGLLTAVVVHAQEKTEPEAVWSEYETRFSAAYEKQDYAAALKLAEEMRDQLEDRYYNTLYNIACMHCRLGHREESLASLEHAVNAGFWDARSMWRDEDFAALREDKQFRALAERAWANGYIAMLERPEREDFQKPREVMEALKLKHGERVADIGAGSGYFTLRFAEAVGPAGKVLALDIRQTMLDYIDKRLKKNEIGNVQLKLVQPDDPLLEPASVDTIIMIDTLHYIKDRVAYVKKLRAALVPGGRIVIIDYKPRLWDERPWGPPPQQQIAKETIDADFAQAGFKVLRSHDFLPEQYFVEYGSE